MSWALAHSSEASSTAEAPSRQRRRVAGGHRPVGAAEHRLELGQLLHAGVRAQVLVALEPEERRDQVVHPTRSRRRRRDGGGCVTASSSCSSRPIPHSRGHDRGVLAHRQAGAGLGVARDLGDELLGAQLGQRLEPARVGLGPVEREQHLAQVLVEAMGASEVVSTPPAIPQSIWPSAILLATSDRRLQARAARLLDVVGGRLGGELGSQHALAGEVEVAAVLEHGAGGDLAEDLALEAEARHQRVERGGQHVLVGGRA